MNIRNRIIAHEEIDPQGLLANPRNWRVHKRLQRQALAGVLEEVGWVKSILVNRRTGYVVDGHLRLELALERGEASVPVDFVDLDEEEEALILATFDPLANLAGVDDERLAEVLAAARTDDPAVRELLASIRPPAPKEEKEAEGGLPPAEAALEKWQVKRGQVWSIQGASTMHRLACADSTTPGIWARWLGPGECIRAMWTDPPYGVNYEGKTPEALTIQHDEAGAAALFTKAMKALTPAFCPGAAWFVSLPGGPARLGFEEAVAGQLPGWKWHQGLVWVKDTPVLGHSDFNYQHEDVITGSFGLDTGDRAPAEDAQEQLYGWVGKGHRWYGGRNKRSVFRVKRPTQSLLHPTMKPVELIRQQLALVAFRGDIVCDPFAGSGSTILAAEALGLTALAVELEPKYVAGALERCEREGLVVKLEGDGG